MTTSDEAVLQLASWLNTKARATIVEDGVHAPMFFLELPDGRLDVRLFTPIDQRPVGEIRSREMGDAVRETGATAVAFVSEAWAANEDSVADGQTAGDSVTARDILLVAALDDQGGCVVFETPVRRGPDDTVELGESARADPGLNVIVFDDARQAWAEGAVAETKPMPSDRRGRLFRRLRGG